MWLGEFQRWPGSPAQVEAIPTRPLRPDLPPPLPVAAPPIAVVARPMAALPRRAPAAPRTPVQGKLF
jgi:hypothetical protein